MMMMMALAVFRVLQLRPLVFTLIVLPLSTPSFQAFHQNSRSSRPGGQGKARHFEDQDVDQ